MTSTALITSPRDARDSTTPSASEPSTYGEMLAEIVPLAGAVAGEGPPVIFLAGPWLLFGLMLSGPFAFLVTFVVVMVVAATVLVALAAAIVGIVATPYLLVRRLRRRAPHALMNDHGARLVPVEPGIVA